MAINTTANMAVTNINIDNFPPTPILALLELEDHIRFRFIDHALLHRALQGSKGWSSTKSEEKEKLAVVGRAALRLLLTMEGLSRGETKDRIDYIVANKTGGEHLARQGFAHHIGGYVYDWAYGRECVSDLMMATTMEAILGAVFLDSTKDLRELRKVAGTLDLL